MTSESVYAVQMVVPRTVAILFIGAISLASACGDENFLAGKDDGDGGSDGAVDAAPQGDAANDAGASDAANSGCAFGKGTPMLRVTASGKSFCIDATEVTEQQFKVFSDGIGIAPWVPNDAGLCTGQTDSTDFSAAPLEPAPSLGADYPVGVRWCAARAYCAWAGKRMCRSEVVNGAEVGEFYVACSGGGTRAFGYGNTLDAAACDDGGGLHPVGSLATCTGGVPSEFDINGNRAEWVDHFGTDDAGTPNIYRSVRGLGGNGSCSTVHGVTFDDNSVGFRCCADPQ